MANIKEIRAKTHLSQTQFADYFNIPVNSLRKWERNGATPPPYVVEMVDRILKYEVIIKRQEKKIEQLEKEVASHAN